MLSETGTHTKAQKVNLWQVSTIHGLIRFTVDPEAGSTYDENPIFAVRASLSKPGHPHPHRVLGNLKEYESTDPCLRLPIQYRHVDSLSQAWRWASVEEERSSEARFEERIFKANMLVELLEGKSVADVEGIPRRSLDRLTRRRGDRRGVPIDA